jgi:hypothetical protein
VFHQVDDYKWIGWAKRADTQTQCAAGRPVQLRTVLLGQVFTRAAVAPPGSRLLLVSDPLVVVVEVLERVSCQLERPGPVRDGRLHHDRIKERLDGILDPPLSRLRLGCLLRHLGSTQ